MTTAKNAVFIGLILLGITWKLLFSRVGLTLFLGGGGERRNEQIFGWWGYSPHPHSRESPDHCSILTKIKEKVKNTFRFNIICVHILRKRLLKEIEIQCITACCGGLQHTFVKPRFLFWIIVKNILLARAIQSFFFKLSS